MKQTRNVQVRALRPAATVAVCLILAQPLQAQQLAPAVTRVYDMIRPAYDPMGIRQRGFLIEPQASQTFSFDDNIFATDRRIASDLISTSSESISAASQWSRHALGARLFGTQQVYTQHTTETGFAFGAQGEGRIDIATDTFLRTALGFSQQPQPRGTAELDAAAIGRPVYNSYNGALGLFIGAGRWFGSAQGEVRRNTYVSERDAGRSGTQFTYTGRAGLHFSDYSDVFLEGSYSKRDWERHPDLRNFDLETASIGGRFHITDMLDAELSIGASRQDYSHGAFDTLITPAFNLQLTWNVTPLTSLIATGGRVVLGTETFCGGTPGTCVAGPVRPDQRNTWEATTLSIGGQHEFRHDLLGELRFRYERDAFDFNGLRDDTFSISLGARYLINRQWQAEFEYSHNVRNANLPNDRTYNTGPYEQNVLSVTLKAAF